MVQQVPQCRDLSTVSMDKRTVVHLQATHLGGGVWLVWWRTQQTALLVMLVVRLRRNNVAARDWLSWSSAVSVLLACGS